MTGSLRRGLILLSAAVVGYFGLAIACDRAGLRADYYLNNAEWHGDPVFSRHEHPALIGWENYRSEVRSRVFSVRWTGWIRLTKTGRYRFVAKSTGRSVLRIDGREILAKDDAKPRSRALVKLDRGLHAIEIRYGRPDGESGPFRLMVKEPGGIKGSLTEHDLYASRPGPIVRLVRSWGLSLTQRRLVGIALVASALLIGWWWSKPHHEAIEDSVRRKSGWLFARTRRLKAAFLLTLFLLTFLGSLQFTASPFGFDGVRYMDVATFTRPVGWIVHRYAHIYLLKFFIFLRGGNPFHGSELFWSFMFATTVTAMGVAVAALGKRLQLTSLAVALGLLFAQPAIFIGIGVAYADYTAMMLVTVGVAIYLHGLHRPNGLSAGHVFLLGLSTVFAIKSKELGGVLLWLLPLLALHEGRVDPWRFVKRSSLWLTGAVSALASLVLLDAIYLRQPLFSISSSRLQGSTNFNFARFPQIPRTSGGWMDVIWQGNDYVNRGDMSPGLLGLVVIAAALAAGRKDKRIELRLLSLMPLAYFSAVLLAHVRATYVYLPRYLFPIIPVACVMAAAMFHDSGLDDVWGRLLKSPRWLISTFLVAVFLVLFLLPVLGGSAWSYNLLPWSWLQRVGWQSAGDLVRSTLMPVSALVGLSLLALFMHHRMARPLLMVAVTAILFAPSVGRNYEQLVTRRSVQRAQTFLYPFVTFESKIREGPTRPLSITRAVMDKYRMCGPRVTCQKIGKLYFRGDFKVRLSSKPRPGAFLIGTRDDLERWAGVQPEIRDRSSPDPTGALFLVKPAE